MLPPTKSSSPSQNLPSGPPLPQCHHCGDTCPDTHISKGDAYFCCEGCKMVYEILSEHDMCQYYDLADHPGTQLKQGKSRQRFAYLDHPKIVSQLLDYQDQSRSSITLYLPQIHCASCIWLLENLYKLHPGIQQTRVFFMKKQVQITFLQEQISLRALVELLTDIGYEPSIHLQDGQKSSGRHADNSFYLKLGIAGFCFGNIMLFSFPEYLGLEMTGAGGFHQFFSWLNVVLALPVLLYSAQVFFRPALQGIRQRRINIDVPVSIGILALFIRSLVEILSQTGAGYMDSLAGLVFFLLIGKWFQRKSYDHIAFDKDYTGYFPIASTRVVEGKEESVPVMDIVQDDVLRIRSQELIPADAVLVSPQAAIDYSFVTGEAEPVERIAGNLLYAGGRQVGGAIEVRVIKPVSQSYLTQIWDQTSDTSSQMDSYADQLSKYFTWIILLIATLAGSYWWYTAGLTEALGVFTAVLIVACPCGLALTSPIIQGNTLRLFGRQGFYLKKAQILEHMPRIKHIVFDKTGTLTSKQAQKQVGLPTDFAPEEQALVSALTSQSLHPISKEIRRRLGESQQQVAHFIEYKGEGIEGWIEGQRVLLGSAPFIASLQKPPHAPLSPGTYACINGKIIGPFDIRHDYREGIATLLRELQSQYNLSLLSGDTDREAERMGQLFPEGTPLHFFQKPDDKYEYVQKLQATEQPVMMVGDGLNDAGALKEAHVGIAVADTTEAFSPACDGILSGDHLKHLPRFMRWAAHNQQLIQWGFIISLIYNSVGLAIAVMGWLTPLIAAVLMPLSSITVVIYGMGSTWMLGKRMSREMTKVNPAPYSHHVQRELEPLI
ncbi:MAG: heavy metal translocating P-type ATPase metal-binding domain-containing protein [Bacteroidota bacterium]